MLQLHLLIHLAGSVGFIYRFFRPVRGVIGLEIWNELRRLPIHHLNIVKVVIGGLCCILNGIGLLTHISVCFYTILCDTFLCEFSCVVDSVGSLVSQLCVRVSDLILNVHQILIVLIFGSDSPLR